MRNLFVFMAMIFLHIIDDYVLQAPSLSNLKQKCWWEKFAPEPMYKYDYIVGLAMHSMSWSFMIMLPIMISWKFQAEYNWQLAIFFVWIINAVIHGILDDLKANRHKTNLIVDQGLHLVQIVVTAFIFNVI